MRRLASALELSDSVRDQACQLFRSTQNEDLLRGRSIEAIAAAKVYGACRCNGLLRMLEEITETARIGKSRVTNAYKTLNEEFGLLTEPMTSSMFVPQLASDLDCPNRIRQRASTLAERAGDAGVTSGVDDVIVYLREYTEPLAPEYEATINLWLSRIDGTDQLSRDQERDTADNEASHEPNDYDTNPIVRSEYSHRK